MNNLTIKDKVAIILAKYGFSLTEGSDIYEMTITEKESVTISIENDCVVWCTAPGEHSECFGLWIWKNYRKDFCLNYALAGAVALDDEDLAISEEEDKALMIEFFKCCQDNLCKGQPMPMLPERLQWLFTSAGTTDYVDADEYEITDNTTININI